jgi:alpha-beta hydrolase superfamily lysophospholipase
MKANPIVLIHGMYMNALCWEQWGNHFQAKGYECLAPAWPGRDRPVDSLRKNHPDPDLGKLTLTDVVEKLDTKPVLIGHSMGGLIGQKGWEEVADYILTWLNEKGL